MGGCGRKGRYDGNQVDVRDDYLPAPTFSDRRPGQLGFPFQYVFDDGRHVFSRTADGDPVPNGGLGFFCGNIFFRPSSASQHGPSPQPYACHVPFATVLTRHARWNQVRLPFRHLSGEKRRIT